MSEEPIRIRRYPNRRFYDRSRRRYVTLGEIEDLVREGRTVVVEDARTGADMTSQLLAQILLERHPDKMEFFPAALLHGLLRANDLATEFWRAHLRQTLMTLEGLKRAVGPFAPSPLPWLPGLPGLMPGLVPTSVGPPPPAPPPAPAGEDAEALRRRLAELEGRLARLEARPAAPPRPRRRRKTAPADDRPEAGDAEAPIDDLEDRLRDLERRSRG